MTDTPKEPQWFMYYPGPESINYRWSSAMMGILSAQPWLGSEMSEVDRVGRRLRPHLGDDEAWFREWRQLGEDTHKLARDAEAAGHQLTAAGAYLRACSYYQWGERFRIPKDELALETFRTSIECFHRFAELTDEPEIEIVDVPCEDGTLAGLLCLPRGARDKKWPCIVFFDGLDHTKELIYTRGVPEILRRGIGVLLIDGFGLGESIRFRGFPLRGDSEVAGSAAFDYLAARDDVDPDRIGVMGISLGGYFAPRVASRDSRFKVCVCWAAIWDYYATWKKRIESGFTIAQSVPGEYIKWVLQVDSYEDALSKLEEFRMEGIAEKVTCPFLLVHGTEDKQASLEDARLQFAAIASKNKTFRIVTEEEGGAQHCTRDNMTLGSTYIGDWLMDNL